MAVDGIVTGNLKLASAIEVGSPTERLVVSGGNLLEYDESSYSNVEIIRNGSFESSAAWTFDTGWTYDAVEKHAIKAPGTTNVLVQYNVSTDLMLNDVYRTQFRIKNYVSGTIRFCFTSGLNMYTYCGEPRSGNGLYTQVMTALANVIVRLIPSSDFEGAIDDVSIVEMREK